MSRKTVEKILVHRTHEQGKLPRNMSRETWSSVRGLSRVKLKITCSFEFIKLPIVMYINKYSTTIYIFNTILKTGYFLNSLRSKEIILKSVNKQCLPAYDADNSILIVCLEVQFQHSISSKYFICFIHRATFMENKIWLCQINAFI